MLKQLNGASWDEVFLLAFVDILKMVAAYVLYKTIKNYVKKEISNDMFRGIHKYITILGLIFLAPIGICLFVFLLIPLASLDYGGFLRTYIFLAAWTTIAIYNACRGK